MGNCVSSSSAVEPSQARLLDKKKSKKENATKTVTSILEATEAGDSSTAELDATLPLSPFSPSPSSTHEWRGGHGRRSSSPDASLPPPSLNITPITFRLVDDDDERAMVTPPGRISASGGRYARSYSSSGASAAAARRRHSSVSTVVSSGSSMGSQSTSGLSLSSSSSPRRRNRALQARLDKARSVQRALTSSSSPGRGGRRGDRDDDSQASSSPGSSPRRGEALSHPAIGSAFDGTSGVWSSLDFDSTGVTAIAFGKTGASLSSLPLLMAVGTAEGNVTLHTWTDEKSSPPAITIAAATASSSSSSSPPRQQQPKQSVEHSRFTVGRLDRQVRAVDLDASGTHLAAGGDDCVCTIYGLRWKQQEVGNDREFSNSLASMLESVEVVARLRRVDRVYTVAFGGAYLAVGGFDGIVAVISVKDWQCVAEVARDGLVYSVDWSFDARHLAIAGSDKTLAIVDTKRSWNVWKEIKTGAGSAQAVRFRPHSYSLAVGGSFLSIVKDWTVKHHLNLTEAGSRGADKLYKIHSLSWSPTGTYLVLVDSLNKCKLLETSGFSVVHELCRLHPLHSVAWGELYRYSGLPRRYISIGSDGAHSQVILVKAGLEFHSSDTSVVSGADDYSASVASSFVSSSSIGRGSYLPDWTMQEHMFRNVDEILDLSTSRIVVEQENVLAVCFSRGSRSRPSTYLAYSLDDGRVIVRSTLEFKVVAELLFNKPIKCLDFSVGSRFLALGSAESRLHVVETAPSWTIVAKHDFFAPISAVGFSKRNERLAVGVADGILALFDPQDDFASVGEIDASESPVICLDWSGKNFCLGRQDGTVSIYDSQQVCANFCVPVAEHELCSPVQAVAFGPNSRFVAAGAANGLINVYSAKGGWVLCHQIRGPVEGLASIDWNASGRLLAFGGRDGTVKMVDTIFWADVEELSEALKGKDNCDSLRSVSSVAFGQDGVAFACVAPDGDGLRVVDTNKWKLVFSHHDPPQDPGDESSISSY